MRVRVLVLAMAIVALRAPLAGAGPLQDDLIARRAAVMARLAPETIAIVWSAPTRVYSLDVDYEYRQDSNLLYLTGITQPDTILVLMPGNKTQRELLFVREPDARREHREGHVLTKDEVTAASGIRTVHYVSQFEPFLAAMFNRVPFGGAPLGETGEYGAFFAAVSAGRASLALPLGPRLLPSAPLPASYEFANKARERFLGVGITDSWETLAHLRQVKTPYEIALLDTSGTISSDAHLAGMGTARPGRFEYEVEAAIEHVFLSRGAMSWGYPSIVGSGPNATVLHYGASSRQMRDGELLLVDAAASFQGYTVDITRTYPVNGRFTEAQKDLYRLVLAAQEAGMRAAVIGKKTSDVGAAAADVVKAGLLKLGLITDASGEQFRTWYTHGIVHWIGLDVHDVGDYDRPLAPGMTFVIEPGLYIRPDALDNLSDTPENRAFKAAVRPAVEKYRNLGVRIEDSFVLTEQGLKSLSASVPKTIEAVEQRLQTRGTR